MKFVNRETQYPGKRKLIKVDPNNVSLGKDPILVNIIKDEGIVTVEGTPITAENLNKGNWRDDDSLSFMMLEDNDLPNADKGMTKMVTTLDGETWIISQVGAEEKKVKVSNSVGTAVKINGIIQQDLNFISDPQTQISAVEHAADVAENMAASAQGTANGRSTVKINGVRADINFTSDPQTQISNHISDNSVHVSQSFLDKITVFGGNTGDILTQDPSGKFVPQAPRGGGVVKAGGAVQMNVTSDAGKTVLFTSAVTGIMISGSSVAPGNPGYIDDETRFIFTTGPSAITPVISNIDYIFPGSPVFKANTKYMVAVFGRVLTFSEGV